MKLGYEAQVSKIAKKTALPPKGIDHEIKTF